MRQFLSRSRWGVAAAAGVLACLVVGGVGTPVRAQNPYPLTEDSKKQDGVPQGEVLHFTFDKSKIFPGTFQDYWVYIPAQYTPDKPACVYVNQDGIGWNAPTVFDNLIAKKDMPVTIGVFIMHGRVLAKDGKTALDRFNRSYEYDGLGDNYARFVLEEILPDVETKKASDGRAIRLSHSGNDRAIGGASSGAIAAFTAAWERPDAFSRVFSVIGTYVGLRGGERYSTLIRKTEPKPLRIYLNDGSNDLNIYGGDWWMANQMMERAFTFSGYEVNHVWGELGHDGRQGAMLFPDAMRWLWKDWPAPVKAGTSKNGMLNDIILPGEGWQEASTVPPGAPGAGQSFGPDGRKYGVNAKGEVVVTPANGGKETTFAKGMHATDVVVAHNGNAYVVEPGKVWLVRPDGKKQLATTGTPGFNGVTLAPDQTLLYVSDRLSHWVYSYQVQPDGTLLYGQRYYWMHSPDDDDESPNGVIDGSGASGMCVDKAGRLYVATRLGIQVCDQAGRVNVILPLPGNATATSVRFGGPNSDTLYVTAGGKLYARKMKAVSANSWDAPIRPAPPGL